MDNTRETGLNPPPSLYTRIDWVDRDTAKNIQNIVLNLALEKIQASLQTTAALNAPLRMFDCINAFQSKKYWKVAFNIAAFASLFLPMGRPAAIAIDLFSEAVNVYFKIRGSSSAQNNTREIVRSNQLPGTGTSVAWVDQNTAKTIYYVVLNIFLIRMQTSLQTTAGVNLPLRMFNCVKIFQRNEPLKAAMVALFQDKEYREAAFDVMTFAFLFFPMGRQAAIAVDLFSATISIYLKIKSSNNGIGPLFSPVLNKPKLDCTIIDNAIKVLSLSEEQAKDKVFLEARYTDLRESYTKRLNGVNSTNPLRLRFQTLLAEVEEAYETLKSI